jgi:hypothetical protein
MANVRLSYKDFIPIKGSKKREYKSTSTGEVISVRQFQKYATRTEIPEKPKTPRKRSTPTKKSEKRTQEKQVVTPQKKTHKRREEFKNREQLEVPSTLSDEFKDFSEYSPIRPLNEKQIERERYNHAARAYADRVNRETATYDLEFKKVGPTWAKSNLEFKEHYKAYKNGADRKKGGDRHMALLSFGYLEEGDEYY